MQTKPVDRTKKSNRRCVNCEHYPHNSTYYTGADVIKNPCKMSGKSVEYWNCCKDFCWSTRKKYTDTEPPKEDDNEN